MGVSPQETPQFKDLPLPADEARAARNEYADTDVSNFYSRLTLGDFERLAPRLNQSSGPLDHETAGWVNAEQGLIIAHSHFLSALFEIEPYFDVAEESFVAALESYDGTTLDGAICLCHTELALASMPLYRSWAKGEPPDKEMIAHYSEDVRETAYKADELKEQDDGYNRDRLEALASELVIILGLTRRQRQEPIGLFAVPSSLRQRGDLLRYGHPDGWDVSVVAKSRRSWRLVRRLSVRKRQTLSHKPRSAYEVMPAYYERLHPNGTAWDVWGTLQGLADNVEPGAAAERHRVKSLSRRLYEYIELEAPSPRAQQEKVRRPYAVQTHLGEDDQY